MESSGLTKLAKLLLLAVASLYAHTCLSTTVGLAVEGRTQQVEQFYSQLNQATPEHNIVLVDLDNPTKQHPKDISRWVAVGVKALAKVMSRTDDDVPVLGLFVKIEALDQLKRLHPTQSFSLLSNEPPIKRQMALLHVLHGGFKRVAIFHSPLTEGEYASLVPFAESLQLELLLTPLKDPLNWDRKALQALKQVDAVLGVHDDAIYNATNIRSLLMRLYRAGKPLIGPDKGYVRAGAVASTYSSVQDTIDAVRVLLAKETWNEVEYNPFFSVEQNTQVARSLNIPTENDQVLEAAVKELLRGE